MSSDVKNDDRRSDLLQKQRYYKTFHVSMAVTALLLAGVAGVFAIDNVARPMISTSSYHFNVQYRVGNPEAMDKVVNNSLVPILQMYGRHPTWKANIEFQGQMLDWMHKMDTEGSIRLSNITLKNGTFVSGLKSLDLLRMLVDEKRVELILVQYSDALALAYPYLSFYKSVNYTRRLIDFYNISHVSRAVLLQEGQFMLGCARLLEDFTYSNGTPIYDTFMIFRMDLSYFHVTNPAPLYEWEFSPTGDPESSWTSESINVLPHWILPTCEEGVMHHSLWVQDGENVDTGEGQTWVAGDFEFNPYKLANHERRLELLEKTGNEFLNLDEWIDRMEPKKEKLNSYVPETHWQGFNYRSSFVWMGQGGSGYVDDGVICALNYRVHQLLQATELLLNYSYFSEGALSAGEYFTLHENLTQAWMDLADAMVTDTTGLDPADYENEHAFTMTTYAIENATAVKDYVVNKTATLNGTINSTGMLQVLPFNFDPLVDWSGQNQTLYDWSTTIATTESEFTNYTSEGMVSESELPVSLVHKNLLGLNVSNHTLDVSGIPALNGLQYYSVNTQFRHKDNNTDEEDWNYITFVGDFSKIKYSPTLFEGEYISLDRSDYYPDVNDEYGDWARNINVFGDENFEIYLSLSNGLVYSDEGGFALVKNNSASHICGKWNHGDFRFMQTETVNETQPIQFFILENVTISTAVDFANLVNTYSPVNITGGKLA